MADLPDWAIGDIETIREPLTDLAELAVRLGSPQAYERGGSTLLIEDFSRGLGAWDLAQYGEEAFATLSPKHSNYGGFCLLIRGGVEDGEGYADRQFPLENIGRWGIEIGIPYHDGVNFIRITQILGQNTGGAYASLTIDFNNQQVTIYVAQAGDTVVIDDIFMDSNTKAPIVLKLIADHDNNIYTQLYFNEHRRNLRDYALPSDDTYQVGIYDMFIEVREDDTPPGFAYFDYIVVTTDEQDKVIDDT